MIKDQQWHGYKQYTTIYIDEENWIGVVVSSKKNRENIFDGVCLQCDSGLKALRLDKTGLNHPRISFWEILEQFRTAVSTIKPDQYSHAFGRYHDFLVVFAFHFWVGVYVSLLLCV